MESISDRLQADFDVVGRVVNPRDLCDEVVRLRPDLIVSGITLPIQDDVTAMTRLRESHCEARIVLLATYSDSDFVQACIGTAGACGYVVASRIDTDLLPAIREALAGRCFVSHPLTSRDLDGTPRPTR
jgi:DNA-binding NarL/FixJ family response regulator